MLLISMFYFTSALSATEAEQSRVVARPAVVEEMMNCRAIAEPSSRLSCLEASLDAFEAAERGGQIAIVDRVAVAKTSRREFGLRLPRIPLLVTADVDDVENLSSTLVRANQSAAGKWMFALADGSTWRQIDSQVVRRTPAPDTEVTVRRAAMNSFLLSLGSGRSIRVERAP